MSCYLLCHFSGLWAFLMSTLIPLRSGAGVYVTLEEEEEEEEEKQNISHSWPVTCALWRPRLQLPREPPPSSADPDRSGQQASSRAARDVKSNASSQSSRFLWVILCIGSCQWHRFFVFVFVFFQRFVCNITCGLYQTFSLSFS